MWDSKCPQFLFTLLGDECAAWTLRTLTQNCCLGFYNVNLRSHSITTLLAFCIAEAVENWFSVFPLTSMDPGLVPQCKLFLWILSTFQSFNFSSLKLSKYKSHQLWPQLCACHSCSFLESQLASEYWIPISNIFSSGRLLFRHLRALKSVRAFLWTSMSFVTGP